MSKVEDNLEYSHENKVNSKKEKSQLFSSEKTLPKDKKSYYTSFKNSKNLLSPIQKQIKVARISRETGRYIFDILKLYKCSINLCK